ncbi:type II secretion system F family protein [bacterium]|nr:MAG: type II secretion system F family protein [bacterium]
MKTFIYQVIDLDGKSSSGEIESKSKQELLSNLQRDGYIVVHIEEKSDFDLRSLTRIDMTGVPSKDKVFFMKQFSIMVTAGIPIAEALEILAKQAKNFTLKTILTDVQKNVEDGNSLSESFRKHKKLFTDVQINLLNAGESSGKLPEVIEKITKDIERNREFVAKIKGAMIYPIIVFVVIIFAVIILMVFMIPEMTKLFDSFGAELPKLTQVMVGISNFLNPAKSYGGIILTVISIISLIYLRSYRKTASGKIVTDKVILKVPILGKLTRNLDLAQFTRILSVLLSSGVTISEALRITAGAVGNSLYKSAIFEVVDNVEKGTSVSAAMFQTKAFENVLVYIVDTGEKTGKLAKVLADMADYYEVEVKNMTDNLSKLLEPFILIIVAIMVGVLAMAVYLPIFKMASVIK